MQRVIIDSLTPSTQYVYTLCNEQLTTFPACIDRACISRVLATAHRIGGDSDTNFSRAESLSISRPFFPFPPALHAFYG